MQSTANCFKNERIEDNYKDPSWEGALSTMIIVFALVAVFIFGFLVAIHEVGHFLAARLCGVRVNEFSIGMGPCLWHRETDETQYSIRLLPIGGFCALEGQDEDSGDRRSQGYRLFCRTDRHQSGGHEYAPHTSSGWGEDFLFVSGRRGVTAIQA